MRVRSSLLFLKRFRLGCGKVAAVVTHLVTLKRQPKRFARHGGGHAEIGRNFCLPCFMDKAQWESFVAAIRLALTQSSPRRRVLSRAALCTLALDCALVATCIRTATLLDVCDVSLTQANALADVLNKHLSRHLLVVLLAPTHQVFVLHRTALTAKYAAANDPIVVQAAHGTSPVRTSLPRGSCNLLGSIHEACHLASPVVMLTADDTRAARQAALGACGWLLDYAAVYAMDSLPVVFFQVLLDSSAASNAWAHENWDIVPNNLSHVPLCLVRATVNGKSFLPLPYVSSLHLTQSCRIIVFFTPKIA